MALDVRAWRGLLVLLLAVIAWLAFTPRTFNDGGLPLDKLRHALAFAVLAAVAVQGFGHTRRALLGITLGLAAYGVGIEWVQGFIPGRHASLADVVSDLVGIAIGLALALAFKRWQRPAAASPSSRR
jgi:VanZ family protein